MALILLIADLVSISKGMRQLSSVALTDDDPDEGVANKQTRKCVLCTFYANGNESGLVFF